MENGIESISIPANGQAAALALPSDAAQSGQDRSAALRKRVLIGFGGVMAIGLAVATTYIGGRIFAARSTRGGPAQVAWKPGARAAPAMPRAAVPHAPPGAPQLAVIRPLEAPPQPEARVEKADASSKGASGPRQLVDPKQGEVYLQLAALGPTATDRYLPRLAEAGIHALVAPGPEASVYRILLGPFADRTALELQQRMLEMQGIEPFARKY